MEEPPKQESSLENAKIATKSLRKLLASLAEQSTGQENVDVFKARTYISKTLEQLDILEDSLEKMQNK